MRAILGIIIAFAALAASPAEARHRAVRAPASYAAHPDCNILWPCAGVEPSRRGAIFAEKANFGSAVQRYTPAVSRKAARRASAGRPAGREIARHQSPSRTEISPVAASGPTWAAPMRYIAGRLVCALNVGAALAERGIKGTGSALAHSYDSWGRASGPVPGAVAVTDRRGGGHVAIVSRVEGGRVYVWNATGGRHGWHEIEYTNRRARYRVAG